MPALRGTITKVKDGEDAIVVSKTEPQNPKVNQLWQSESGKQIKRWDGYKWVVYYISVENLDVKNLSAISADLGTVTAGSIKNKDETVELNVEEGKLFTSDKNGKSSGHYSGGSTYFGKDANGNMSTLSIGFEQILSQVGSAAGRSCKITPMGSDFYIGSGNSSAHDENTTHIPIYESLLNGVRFKKNEEKNLTYGCWEEGFYSIQPFAKGAPNNWGGIMYTHKILDSSGQLYMIMKFAICADCKIYVMRQTAKGAVEQGWTAQ